MPTENRSRNTEQMVSVPRDEVERLVKLLQYQAHPYPSPHAEFWQGLLDAPAAQPQGQPVGYRWEQLGGNGWCYGETLPAIIIGAWQELYTHADAGEVADLRAMAEKLGRENAELRSLATAAEGERDPLRAQLALWSVLLKEASYSLKRERCEMPDDSLAKRIDAALSASAEPNAPNCKHPVKCARFNNGEIVDHVCQDCLQVFAPSTPVERDQGIPGTSFQRLNMLANQGE